MHLTAQLPGVGGLLKASPEDFLVEELPAYLPSGSGEHTYLFIEKRGLTTEEALMRLCQATGAARDAAGAAGMKDRQAITRQWISIPGVDPTAALALSIDKVHVLQAARHGNKLRTGHLRGNRFTLVLRGLRCDQAEAIARTRAILAALAGGLPNRFGSQRFGARGDNAARGRELLRVGEDRRGGRRLGRGERRLLVSALQSQLFNEYLEARMEAGLLRVAIDGDLLRRRDSGGLFPVRATDLAEAQARVDRGELDVSGPMFGHKMIAPADDSAAALREAELLRKHELSAAQFATLGPIAEGTRRALTVPIDDAEVEPADSADAIRLRFSLPSGAYATVLIDEISKNG